MTFQIRSLIENSPICPVIFAGFKSDTYELSRCGWRIAVNQFHLPHRAAEIVRLMMTHEGLGVTGISNGLEIDYKSMMSHEFFMRRIAPLMCFNIEAIHPDIKVLTISQKNFLVDGWYEANMEPTFRSAPEEISLKNLKIFRPLKTDVPEIYIPTHDVDALMDMILKKQDPIQKEIRERQRRDLREGKIISLEPHDVKCQILSFAS